MKKFTTKFSRSNHVESVHNIKILVSDINNNILLSSKNDNDFIFPRSSIKIFQAIPFILSNSVKHYNLSPKEIALSCSSHRGEIYHISQLNKWINKIGISKRKLKCGIHYPLNPNASKKLIQFKKLPDELHNNCAGKHLAMITSCLKSNYDMKYYLDFHHPHQIKIRKVFQKFTSKKIYSKSFGIDGCSAPQYSFKIKDILKMLINLIKSYNNNFEYSDEVKLLINSILKNPRYIGGIDSLDSRIMEISNKNIFCKGGAEGVFLFAELKKGIAGIIKIEDGNERAIPSVIYNTFKKLKIFNNKDLLSLNKVYNFNIVNHANLSVGKITTKI